MFQHTAARRRLVGIFLKLLTVAVFQHTAARRRLVSYGSIASTLIDVSTHSRPKAAGMSRSPAKAVCPCFNTQPPEGGWHCGSDRIYFAPTVSTHSRPKAAGWPSAWLKRLNNCFNTQPPEGGWFPNILACDELPEFQHTAARRRLENFKAWLDGFDCVSTHSRPKAAGCFWLSVF